MIQEIAARMGVVTGKGTADLIRERFGVKVTAFAMFALFIANLGTTVAQIAGVAASAELFGISRYIAAPLAAILISYSVLKLSLIHIYSYINYNPKILIVKKINILKNFVV